MRTSRKDHDFEVSRYQLLQATEETGFYLFCGDRREARAGGWPAFLVEVLEVPWARSFEMTLSHSDGAPTPIDGYLSLNWPQRQIVTTVTILSHRLDLSASHFTFYIMSTCEAGIPLYAVQFVDKDHIIAAGGGGQGKHGVANKLILLEYDYKTETCQISKENILPAGSDCPMSMAVYGPRLYTGINSTGSTENPHFRVMDPQTLQDLAAVQVFTGDTPKGVYQRITAASEDLVAIVGSSPNSSKSYIYVVERKDPTATLWSMTVDSDVSDLSFDITGSSLAAATPQAVLIWEAQTGKVVHELPAPSNWQIVRAQYDGETRLVVGLQSRALKKAELRAYEIQDKPMMVYKTGVPSRAISCLGVGGDIIAVGTSSGDVLLFNSRLSRLSHYKGAHKLPVTSVSVNSETGAVASTSIFGSIHVIGKVTAGGSSLLSLSTLIWSSLSVAILAVLALVAFAQLQQDPLMGPFLHWRSGVVSTGVLGHDTASKTETLATATSASYKTETVVETVVLETAETLEISTAVM